MVTNKRRLETSESNPGLSNNYIDVDFEKGTVVNVHGYRATVSIEPQDADANANGFIAVYVLPGGVIQNTDLPLNIGQLGNEDWAPYLWGATLWAASNQTPYLWEFAPKTSRNIQSGGRIVLLVDVSGISAGLVSLNTLQTMFTSNVN